MVHPSSTSLLEIVLDSPHVMIPEQNGRASSRHNSSESNGNAILNGHLIVRLAKTMRIRSLNLVLTGAAHTSFAVVLPLTPTTHGKTIKKAPSVNDSHYENSFRFLTHTWTLLEAKPKGAYTLQPGMHTFPFSVNIDPSLPCTFTTATTAVHYQLTAFLQPASFISFVQGARISQPVILLPSHNQAFLDIARGFETSGYMRLQSTPAATQQQSLPLERISGEAHFPCKIFTQTGTIPVTINVMLLGQGTVLTKISVEMWEAVYKLHDDDDNGSTNIDRRPLDVRLTTRQNCPLSDDWKPSTLDAPSSISKRLLFKVPQLPMPTWSKNKDGYTAMPGRGFCHTSGEYLCSKIKIEHTLKLVLSYQYEVPIEESPSKGSRRSSTGGSNILEETVAILEDSVEAEEQVMIVSHVDPADGGHDAEPPCYYRSFTSVPVNPNHIPYIDAAIAQTLHDDPHEQHDASATSSSRLPDYEDCVESTTGSNSGSNSSTRTNSLRSLSSGSVRESIRDAMSFYSSSSSLDHFGAMPDTSQQRSGSGNGGDVSPSRRLSSEFYQHRDLSSYIERYSRGEVPPIPF